MRIALYIIWFLIPLTFFLMSLWAYLEMLGDKHRKENPADHFRQGIFVLACDLIAVAIDQYLLEDLLNVVFGAWVPLMFAQIVLLPVVLYIGALILGPSRAILIGSAPRPSEKGKDRRKSGGKK
jgi:hypothetical protein